MIVVGQLDDSGDLLGRFGKDDGFGHVVVRRVGHFVVGVGLHFIRICRDVFRADGSLQFF